MAEVPIQIRVHSPERRQRGGVVLYGTCCCSCCCCCLHTVGSVLGAMFASAPKYQAQKQGSLSPGALEKFQPSHPAAASDQLTEPPDEALAPASSGPTDASPPLRLPDRWELEDQSLPGAGLYWLMVLILTVIAGVWAAFRSRSPLEDVLLVVFIYLPAVQLAAAAVAALLVLFWPPDQRPPRWRTIGRLALWSFVGTILGLLVMTPCLFIH